MSRYVDTSSTTQTGQHHGQTLKIQWIFLNEICMVIHLLLCERHFKEVLLGLGWRKRTELGMSVCSPKTKMIRIVIRRMTWKWLEDRIIWLPMRKKLMELVDLDEPTSFLDHKTLGCTQRERRHYQNNIEKYSTSRISCDSNWKITRMGETSRKNCRGVVRHGKPCEKMRRRIVWVGKPKRLGKCTKYQLHVWTTVTSRKKNRRRLESFPKLCSQIVLKCLYLARIGRPDILGPWTRLARAVTKWTGAFDQRLARLISYIHHTSDHRQHCHVGNTAQQCRLGSFQDSDCCWWLLKTQNQHQEENLMYPRKSNICLHKLDV